MCPCTYYICTLICLMGHCIVYIYVLIIYVSMTELYLYIVLTNGPLYCLYLSIDHLCVNILIMMVYTAPIGHYNDDLDGHSCVHSRLLFTYRSLIDHLPCLTVTNCAIQSASALGWVFNKYTSINSPWPWPWYLCVYFYKDAYAMRVIFGVCDVCHFWRMRYVSFLAYAICVIFGVCDYVSFLAYAMRVIFGVCDYVSFLAYFGPYSSIVLTWWSLWMMCVLKSNNARACLSLRCIKQMNSMCEIAYVYVFL
jgi:hypothetical protein